NDGETTNQLLFNVLVVYDNFRKKTPEIAGSLQLSEIDVIQHFAKFDLCFSFEEKEKKLVTKIQFNKTLFSQDKMRLLKEKFLMLIDVITDNSSISFESIVKKIDSELDSNISAENDFLMKIDI
ncbi:MAG: condensation domain-containing protein, partial [Bacteroidota bacterium]